jgi:alpha-D-ribose 1-methylphosphonate 5-triphosphate synthase subunit PhnG
MVTDHSAARQKAMAAFAQADRKELADGVAAGLADKADQAGWSFLRKPETGLIMARGRMGGSGAPFNFGEVTVTRCSVTIQGGETGHATIMGRDKEKARLAALADALWQDADRRGTVEALIVEPVLDRISRVDDAIRAATQATKVEFFTLARGED